MPNEPSYPLFELSPEEFERLCIELLTAPETGLSRVQQDAPRWIDAVAIRETPTGNRTVAIEVSHRTTLHPEGLRRFLERVSKEGKKFEEYIFITSSPIADIHRETLSKSSVTRDPNVEVQILGQEQVNALLKKNANIAAKYFKRDRAKRRRAIQLFSLIVFGISVIGLGFSLHRLYRVNAKSASQFVTQIRSVEESLGRLADLEESLRDLKSELQHKAEESIRISKDYEDAMELKTLTAKQLEQVRKAIRVHDRGDLLLNYFWGFLLGVAGSVLATILTDRWKQKRELAKPYS